MSSPAESANRPTAARPVGVALPVLFVLLWSTGFIGAKFGLPDADPLMLLALRYTAAALLMVAIAFMAGARWPRGRALIRTAIVGLLIQGCYLVGVFEAIERGMPPAVIALIVGLQPLVTGALAGPILGETVRPRQWVGLALGLAGVALVLSDRLSLPRNIFGGVGFGLIALGGITIGTLYQKRFMGPSDARSGAAVQYIVCALACWPLALLTGETRVAFTPTFLFALGWLTIILSVVTINLFFALIKRGSAAAIVSLMYLVQPVTALLAYIFFGTPIGLPALAGMALVMAAVALINRPGAA
jgi:drug/metabolite transporter (DMT)-like permease